MEIKFEGKRALVTGAGKGIGKAVALRLAECGAEVIAISRTQSDLDELSKAHLKIKCLCLDVGNWENTKKAIEDIEPIDLLVNNAAVLQVKDLGNITEEEVDRIFNINIKAVLNISQVVATGMKKKGHGCSIVNVSSIGGFRAGYPPMCTYNASKGALDQLTRAMAVEYGPHNIRVNSVNPGYVHTKLGLNAFEGESEALKSMKARTPLRKFAELNDIAYPILFLLSDKASMISGVILPIDGGLTATV